MRKRDRKKPAGQPKRDGPGRKRDKVGARVKLNAANAIGSLLVAGLVGGIAQSWAVFAFCALALLTSAFVAGDIRS